MFMTLFALGNTGAATSGLSYTVQIVIADRVGSVLGGIALVSRLVVPRGYFLVGPHVAFAFHLSPRRAPSVWPCWLCSSCLACSDTGERATRRPFRCATATKAA